MAEQAVNDAGWCHAMTLAERLTAGFPGDTGAPGDARTAFRLSSWKLQRPFDRPAFFEQRLALDHLSEADLRGLLAEPMDAVRGRMSAPPSWMTGISTALVTSPPAVQGRFRDLLSDREKAKPEHAFLAVAEPIIEQGLADLEAASADLARRMSCRLFNPAAVPGIFLDTLFRTLGGMVTRVMVLEMHIARLEEHLAGDTPEARFESFIERLRDLRERQALLRAYPVLARAMQDETSRWVETSLELLERLAADGPALRSTFGGGADVRALLSVAGGLADPRRGGRSVAILKFTSGTRIVYKPKSLAVDVHFQELAAWLNDRGVEPRLRTLAVLDRGAYGWAEYARPRHCASVDEVRRFYARQGAYIAVLSILEGTDFHAGNVIAAGEHPALIDLEALFHPHRSLRDAGPRSGDRLAQSLLSDSVLRIGLLPERMFDGSQPDDDALDLSGLGTLDGQITAHGVTHWEAPGTDEMRLVRKRQAILPDENRPSLPDAPVNVLDYRQSIVEGFKATYSLLLAHRDELLAEDGPLMRFRGDEVGVFLRSARTYRRLLKESYHPDLLHDALDRDRHFDLLWVEVERHPELAAVIGAERAALLRGDIPVMVARPDSRDVSTDAGTLQTFFPATSLSSALERVRGMGPADLDRQAWIVEASLATLCEDGPDQSPYPRGGSAASSETRGLRRRLVAAATAVGDRLDALALKGSPGASWIGLHSTGDRFWSIDATDLDLHGGVPGIALFLAYLGAVTRKARYSTLARAAFETMGGQLDEARSDIVRLGAFDGWGGIIYALTHLGVLWRRRDLIAEAGRAASLVPGLLDQDDDFDVCNGAAGCIVALQGLHRCAPSPQLVDAAIRCGDHLLAHAVPVANGMAWPPSGGGTRPLAGFAHGAAGIAWALLELSVWTGEKRFREGAAAARRYERSLFDETAGNWVHLTRRRVPEREESEETSRLSTTWCHGAPGVGLARLRSLALTGLKDARDIRAEIAVAIETTLRDGFGRNHSLGYGDLGNLEVLLEASRILRDVSLRRHVGRLTAEVLRSIETIGVQSAAPFKLETPGLMTGLAGCGFELLRLAEPDRVPSVLVLEPPRLGRSHVR